MTDTNFPYILSGSEKDTRHLNAAFITTTKAKALKMMHILFNKDKKKKKSQNQEISS